MTARAALRRLALLCGLLLPLAIFAETRPTGDPTEKLQSVHKQLQEVQTWLDNARQQQSSLMQALRRDEQKIHHAGRDLRQSRQRLAELKNAHTALTREQETLQARIHSQRAAIRQQLRNSYRVGRGGHLRLILNQQQPDQVARVMRYHEYLQQARTAQIERYRSLLDESESKAAQLHVQRMELERLDREADTRRAALEQSRQQRLRTLGQLKLSIRDGDDRARRLAEDRAQLEELLEKVRQVIPELALERQEVPFSSQRGKLPWPVEGRAVHTYGRRGRRAMLHRNGIRIVTKAGGEVRAVHSGHVVFADWMRRFGLLIIIDHGQGFMSLYGHNESLLKEAGEWVQPGEPIAMVGDSGGQPDAGLYFELRENGKPINPKRWLTASR